MLENIAVGVTILSLGVLINTRETGLRHPRWWLVARGGLTAIACVSLYVAAPKFGPDDSTASLATAFSVLWLPVLILSWFTEPRPREIQPEPADAERSPTG